MVLRERAREMVASLIDAYNRKDVEAVTGLYTEDVHLWSSLGIDNTGRDEVGAHLRQLFVDLPDEHMEADVLVTDGETAVVEVTSHGTSSDGGRYEINFTEVIQFRGGRISGIKTYIDPDDVADIVG